MSLIEIENSGHPYCFRYRTDNLNTLSEIEDNYIYFPNNEKLNDPFDANHEMLEISKDKNELKNLYQLIETKSNNKETKSYFQKHFENKPNELYNFINNNKQKFISKFGIACFTMSNINIMLWATYANNHQGICIQYNCDYDKDFFSNIKIMNYVKKYEKKDYLPISEPDGYIELFYKKLDIWKNEYEIRLVKENHGKYKYNPLAIRTITFGLRTSDEFKNKVIEIVEKNHRHIKLYNSSLLSYSYGLSFKQIEIK
jgi:Protein of unknown function (DUF2971)